MVGPGVPSTDSFLISLHFLQLFAEKPDCYLFVVLTDFQVKKTVIDEEKSKFLSILMTNAFYCRFWMEKSILQQDLIKLEHYIFQFQIQKDNFTSLNSQHCISSSFQPKFCF